MAYESNPTGDSPGQVEGQEGDELEEREPQPDDDSNPQGAQKQLKAYIESKNIAEDLDEQTCIDIGVKVKEYFDDDEQARHDWLEKTEEWTKLATQFLERRTYPWPNSANIKYPLLTMAAVQFAARAYPALVPGPKLISGLVLGRDDQGQKSQSADRVATHMSYQVLYEMEDWEEEMDKLCFIIPIIGCVFKKTYYDQQKKINCSELILPKDLVIDYYAKSLETASRICHVIFRTKNQIEERIRSKMWCDVDLPSYAQADNSKNSSFNEINSVQEPRVSEATPHKFIECHTTWDLDNDGYAEPYIFTVHYDSAKVVRIVARFDEESIETEKDDDGDEIISKINPIHYFTKFSFIPNPSGSIYDLGFGLLIGGINEAINTLANQLIDSGTLNNLSAGFLGRGIRIRSGQNRFQPGEWKPVDFTGDDIKKHIFPLPTKEPSEVLFKLMELLITSGEKVASVAEIFVGKMPGQNTPATTTMASIDQALKVFTAIHKRMYRSLAKEYSKLFKLNCKYVDKNVYFTLNSPQGNIPQKVYAVDYDPKNLSVKPNADPNIISASQKTMKLQSIGELMQLGTINPIEYTKRVLEAAEIENIPQLLVTQPQPSPDQQKAQQEMQLKQMEAQMKEREAQQDAQLEQMRFQLEAMSKQMDIKFKEKELQLKQQGHQMDLAVKAETAQQDLQLGAQEHAQAMTQSTAEHQMTMQQTKEKGKLMREQAAIKRQMMKEKKTSGASK